MPATCPVRGRFIREGKTRFVAWVEVEGRRRKVYVPMSTKLSRYFDPVGKEVRLEKRGRRLWVEQVKLRGRWVWVDASKPVELLKREFERQGKTVETEKTIAGYRFGESPEWMVEYYPRGDHRCDDIRRQGAFFSFIHPNIDKFADPEDPRSRRGREQRD